MSTGAKSELCGEVTEHLAEILDGTAPARLLDHLADCDTCRDARHEAEQARTLAASAGADHRAPADLEQRVLAALDATHDAATDENEDEEDDDEDEQPAAVAKAPKTAALAAPKQPSTPAP